MIKTITVLAAMVLILSCKTKTEQKSLTNISFDETRLIAILNDTTYTKISPQNFKLLQATETINHFSDSVEIEGIRHYLFIDSLKNHQAYNSYLTNLDLGMLKEATAFALDTLENKTIIWGIKHSSYEACPYTTGVEIFATSFKDNRPTKSVMIAKYSTTSDAPYEWKNSIISQIKGDSLYQSYLTESIEYLDDSPNEKRVSQSKLKKASRFKN